jgi:hypothetical protein
MKSYELQPNWKLRLNIGICYFNMYKFIEAKHEFTSYLEEGGDKVPEDKKGQAEELLKKIANLTAELTLVVKPDGARVSVNDEEFGETPLAGPIVLVAGLYKIKIEAEGYKSWVKDMGLAGGDRKTQSVDLEKTGDTSGEQVVVEKEPAAAEKSEAGGKGKKISPLAAGGYAALGLGGALLIAGAALGGTALSTGKNLEDECPGGDCPPDKHDDYDRMKAMALSSDILLSVGGQRP